MMLLPRSRVSPAGRQAHALPPGDVSKDETDEAIGSPASIVFDEAENRMHVRKALPD